MFDVPSSRHRRTSYVVIGEHAGLTLQSGALQFQANTPTFLLCSRAQNGRVFRSSGLPQMKCSCVLSSNATRSSSFPRPWALLRNGRIRANRFCLTNPMPCQFGCLVLCAYSICGGNGPCARCKKRRLAETLASPPSGVAPGKLSASSCKKWPNGRDRRGNRDNQPPLLITIPAIRLTTAAS